MAKKNAYDSEADVIELTTPEATIIDLTEIVQPARKQVDTGDIDFNDELTDLVGGEGNLDQPSELDSLLSDIGGAADEAERPGAGDFAGAMQEAVASMPEADAVGALIDDLDPPPSGAASDEAGEGGEEELDSLLDSLFSSPAATRIASATDEESAEESLEPITPGTESDPAVADEDIPDLAEEVFADFDSLLDGEDMGPEAVPAAPKPVTGSAQAAPKPAPTAKAAPLPTESAPEPAAESAANPVAEDAFPDLDSLLDGLDVEPVAAPEAPSAPAARAVEAVPEEEQGSKEVKARDVLADLDSLLSGGNGGPTAASGPIPAPKATAAPLPAESVPEPAESAANPAAEDAFPDLDSLLDGLDVEPVAAPAAPAPEASSAPAAGAVKAVPEQDSKEDVKQQNIRGRDVLADLDSLLSGRDVGPTAASGQKPAPKATDVPIQAESAPEPAESAAGPVAGDAFPDLDSLLDGLDVEPAAAPAAPVLDPVPEAPAAPVQELREDLDELDLLLDGVESSAEPPVTHDDKAEIDAILDEALLPDDGPAENVAPTLDILLPDEEGETDLSGEDDAVLAAVEQGGEPDPLQPAQLAASEARLEATSCEQPDQDDIAESSAESLPESSSGDGDADLSGNPEEVLRNIDDLVEGASPAFAETLEGLAGRIAALESAIHAPDVSEASDVSGADDAGMERPELDAEAVTEDVLARVRTELAAQQAAAEERSAASVQELAARLAALEADREAASRQEEPSSALVDAVAAQVETQLEARLEERLADRLIERLEASGRIGAPLEERLAEQLLDRLAAPLEDRLAERLTEHLSTSLKERLAAELPSIMEARLTDLLGDKLCDEAAERARGRLLPELEKEVAQAERKAEDETSFALVEMENRITALEGRPTAKWPKTARLAEEVLDRLHGDIDRMAAESASRVLREEIVALMKGLARTGA